MAESKKMLSSVAFGGNWSEELLVVEELETALLTIEEAADACSERPVDGAELHTALQYVRYNVKNGPVLCAAFLKTLHNRNPCLRRSEACEVSQRIRTSAGR